MLGLVVIFLVIDMNSLEKTSLRRGEVGKRGGKGHAAVLFSVGHPFKQLYSIAMHSYS